MTSYPSLFHHFFQRITHINTPTKFKFFKFSKWKKTSNTFFFRSAGILSRGEEAFSLPIQAIVYWKSCIKNI